MRGRIPGEFCGVGYSILPDRERSLETPLYPIHVRQSMANPNSILAFESRFGPQSNPIDIAAFVRSASNQTQLQADEVDNDVIQECRCVIFLPNSSQTLLQMEFTRTSAAWKT